MTTTDRHQQDLDLRDPMAGRELHGSPDDAVQRALPNPLEFRLPVQEFIQNADAQTEAITKRTSALRAERGPLRDCTEAEAEYSELRRAAAEVGRQQVLRYYTAARPELRAQFEAALRENGLNLDQWATVCGNEETAAVLAGTFRGRYTQKYGFAVITAAAVRWLAEQLDQQTVVEAGAGNGYLAYELGRAHIDVRATEPRPRHEGTNHWLGPGPEWARLERADGAEAARSADDRAFLWSWPPPDESCRTAIGLYTGTTLILVGEWESTGWVRAQDLLDRDWRETATMPLRSFPGTRDRITVYHRKETECRQDPT